MNNPAKKIIETIKREKIIPQSRFGIRWKSYLFWLGMGVMVVLGALFFSLIVLNFLDIKPAFFHYVGLGKILRMLILTAPFLWIALLLMAFVLILLMLRKTIYGYRYNLLLASIIGLAFISVAGVLLHFLKFNRSFGEGIYRGAPSFSRSAIFPMEKRWKDGKSGFLAGQVLEVSSDSSFLLLSLGSEEWQVFKNEKTETVFSDPIEIGMQLAVIGEKTGEKKFEAKYINLAPNFPSRNGEKRGMRGQKMPRHNFKNNLPLE